jgi:hypothetical protein|tara:strand:- start:2957 stop:3484 length:528 start_codon:yes stop_codon:yes gene_type:complete
MAQFTISSGDTLRPFKSRSGGVVLESGPESTAQTFRVGAVLELDTQVSTSKHRLRVALTSASTVTSQGIVGVAAEGASSNTDQTAIYWPVNSDTEFIGRSRGLALASTQVGNYYGLFYDSTKTVFGVDMANAVSTSMRVQVTGLVDDVGDTGGQVRFKFAVPAGSTNVWGFGGVN